MTVGAKPHIDRNYENELRDLRRRVLEMGGLVEKQIADAVDALVSRNTVSAEATIARDHTVNQMDVDIDEACLRLLALHQPTARDLRLITTALKINADLERAGDMAQNICERAIELSLEPQLKPFIDIPRMARMTQEMLRDSLNAFVREDVDLALRVIRADEAVDSLLEQLFRELISFMVEDPQTISRALRIIFVSKYLERVADHATNIAEMVVFMVKGKSIRHLAEPPHSL
jgi:phosphate transport system protein